MLSRGDDYASSAKPQIDWDDADAREALVDSRARDAFGCLALLDGRELGPTVAEAAALLATVVGQDLEESADGTFRIARRVAHDRVISTVDPDARHGHKTVARSFDGYKGHVAVDPDSEIITATAVTPGNAGDASVAAELIDDLGRRPRRPDTGAPTVYGDAAYGAGDFLAPSTTHAIAAAARSSPRHGRGQFTKDHFAIDLHDAPSPAPPASPSPSAAGSTATGSPLRRALRHLPAARRVHHRRGRPQRSRRPLRELLADARARQTRPRLGRNYRRTRPKVERKLGHLMRRRHGGRRARVRGTAKVDADFNLLAAAANLARLAVLGVHSTRAGWQVATA